MTATTPRSFLSNAVTDYVLQRALSVVEGEQKDALIDMVKPHLVNMRKYSSHSRHLIASTYAIRAHFPVLKV